MKRGGGEFTFLDRKLTHCISANSPWRHLINHLVTIIVSYIHRQQPSALILTSHVMVKPILRRIKLTLKNIQIHPMLQLNDDVAKFHLKRYHSNTSHVIVKQTRCLQANSMLEHSNTSHVIVKPCVWRKNNAYGFIQIHPMLQLNCKRWGLDPQAGGHSNTSHVIVKRARGAGGSETALIQIHPMLQLNPFDASRTSQTPYSNTSHVIVKRGFPGRFCDPDRIQIHPMLQLNVADISGALDDLEFKYIPCYS